MSNKTQDVVPELVELTFGQKLMGVRFNPSQDSKVDRIKAVFAEVADTLFEAAESKADENGEVDEVLSLLLHHSFGELVNAQMNAVKCITYK